MRRTKLCPRCRIDQTAPNRGYCRDCGNAHKRETRPKYSELSPEQRRRSICRSYTGVLIRRGVLKRGPCTACRTRRNVEAHHADYSRPREVTWMCRRCHRARHRAEAA